MAVEIPVPALSSSEINVTLGGISYNIIFRENGREVDDNGNGRLYFDVYTEDVLVKGGVKIMENQSLLYRYLLDGFPSGDILCLSRSGDSDGVSTLSNTGLGKAYGLFYLTNEELGVE